MAGSYHQRWIANFAIILGLSGIIVALSRGQIECGLFYVAGRGFLSVGWLPLIAGLLLPCFSLFACTVLVFIAWHLIGSHWKRAVLFLLAFASVGCLAIPSKCSAGGRHFLAGVADEIRSRNSLPTIISVAEAAKKVRQTTDSNFVRDANVRTQVATILGRQYPDVLSGTSIAGDAVVDIVYGSAHGHWSIRVGSKPESVNDTWLLQIGTNVYLRWLP